jgi:opacity protein-like surface antigen
VKTLCVVLAAAALLSVPASALAVDQDLPADGGLAGKQALQFSVESFLSLAEFQGQMFSYQRFLTDSRAIRVAGGLFLDLNKKDQDVEYYGGEQSGTAETSAWSHRATLKVQMQFYRGDGPLRFFWGAGPKVTYADAHSEDVDFNTHSDELEFIYFTRDTDRWEVGLQGFAGVEWFINEMFSLHAEYGVSGVYTFEDKLEHRVYSSGPDYTFMLATTTRSPEFNSDGVRFGLSARF